MPVPLHQPHRVVAVHTCWQEERDAVHLSGGTTRCAFFGGKKASSVAVSRVEPYPDEEDDRLDRPNPSIRMAKEDVGF